MKGVIDMHVHTNPDLRLRAYDDLELTDAAVKVGARAIVIKTLLKLTAQSKQRLPFGKIPLRPNRLKRSNALSRHTTKQAETNLYPPKKTVPSSAMAIQQNALAKTTHCP